MARKSLSKKDLLRKYIQVQGCGYKLPCVFHQVDGDWYVMAKSLVHAVTDKLLPYKKDPYVDKVISLCGDDICYFKVACSETIKSVWTDRTPVSTPKLTFAKVTTILLNFEKIFSDVDEGDLAENRIDLETAISELG